MANNQDKWEFMGRVPHKGRLSEFYYDPDTTAIIELCTIGYGFNRPQAQRLVDKWIQGIDAEERQRLAT